MLDVLKLLTELGITYKSGGMNNVKIKCINPNHKDKDPSMFVHKETGQINCFGCGTKGSILTLFKEQGVSYTDSLQYLKRFAKGGFNTDEVLKELEEFVHKRQKTSTGYAETISRDVVLPTHREMTSNVYLESRGLSQDEIKFWNMSIVTDGRNTGAVLIPIYQYGELCNYFMRSTFGKGKYYGPYPVNDLLFGIDTANDTTKDIYIVEGIFDMIFLRRTRRQCVAALTNRLSDAQRTKLKKYPKVVIVPDSDERGFVLAQTASPLIHNTNVQVCRLPEGKKDAAECTLEELLRAVYTEVPVQKYLLEEVIHGTITN